MTEATYGGDAYTAPRAGSAALVFIDMQRDFYEDDAPLPVPGTKQALGSMSRLAAAFRAARLPIFHVIRLYRPDGSNVDVARRAQIEGGARIVAPGSAGSQIAPQLLPGPTTLDHEALLRGEPQQLGEREHVLYKPRWGAFYGTTLEAQLRGQGVDTVVFAGCNFPNCPRTSVYEASERDFRVVLVAEAMSGVYERGVEECRRIGVRVWDLGETEKWLDAGA
jgi:nicotinamidase-related amidase